MARAINAALTAVLMGWLLFLPIVGLWAVGDAYLVAGVARRNDARHGFR